MANVVVPRSFKLLDELEQAEKGKYDAKYGNAVQFISIGLDNPEDMMLQRWNATLIPAQGTPIGDRFYALTIETGENYPHVPPRVRFKQRVQAPCVDGAGNVDVSKPVRKANNEQRANKAHFPPAAAQHSPAHTAAAFFRRFSRGCQFSHAHAHNIYIATRRIPGLAWRYEASMMDVMVALRQMLANPGVASRCASVQGDY